MNDTENLSLNRFAKSIQPYFQAGSPPPRRCPPWCFGEEPSLLLVRDRRWSGLRCSAAAPPSHDPPIRKNIEGLVDWKLHLLDFNRNTMLIQFLWTDLWKKLTILTALFWAVVAECSGVVWPDKSHTSVRASFWKTEKHWGESLQSWDKRTSSKSLRVFRVEKVNLKQKFGAGEWADRSRGVEQSFLSLGFQDAVHVLDLDCFCHRD